MENRLYIAKRFFAKSSVWTNFTDDYISRIKIPHTFERQCHTNAEVQEFCLVEKLVNTNAIPLPPPPLPLPTTHPTDWALGLEHSWFDDQATNRCYDLLSNSILVSRMCLWKKTVVVKGRASRERDERYT